MDFSSSFLRNAADFFLGKAAASEDKEFQSFCISQALEFTYDEDLISMIASWLADDCKITIDGKLLDLKIEPEQRNLMIRIVFKSVYMSTEEKQELLNKILPESKTATHATLTTRT